VDVGRGALVWVGHITMRLEFSGPFLESLNEKRQSFPGERSRKLQTHRRLAQQMQVAVHACGNAAVKGWSWPSFWADTAPFTHVTLIEKGDLSLVGSMEVVWWL
jgi:hypothetical protein